MNKVYRILCIGLSLIMMLSASGCQLAKTEEEQKSEINNDKFVGVFITYRAPLHGAEDYIEQKFSGDSIPDKVYAELVEVEYDGIKSHEYVFKDYEGIPYFVAEISTEVSGMDGAYMTTVMNECIFDGSREWMTSNNEEYVNIKGSIYFAEEVMIYENPVYQEEDGDIYFVPANMGVWIANGVERSSTTEENYNGGGVSVELLCTVEAASDEIEVVYLSGDNNVISSRSYKSEEIPEKLIVPKDAEYVMVKNTSINNENAQMHIYTKEDILFETKVKGDGCAYTCSSTELVWEE